MQTVHTHFIVVCLSLWSHDEGLQPQSRGVGLFLHVGPHKYKVSYLILQTCADPGHFKPDTFHLQAVSETADFFTEPVLSLALSLAKEVFDSYTKIFLICYINHINNNQGLILIMKTVDILNEEKRRLTFEFTSAKPSCCPWLKMIH